jgi:hypothetical protein
MALPPGLGIVSPATIMQRFLQEDERAEGIGTLDVTAA